MKKTLFLLGIIISLIVTLACTPTPPPTEIPTNTPTNTPTETKAPTETPNPTNTTSPTPKPKCKKNCNKKAVKHSNHNPSTEETPVPAGISLSKDTSKYTSNGLLTIGENTFEVYDVVLPNSGAGQLGEAFVLHAINSDVNGKSVWVSPKIGEVVTYVDLDGNTFRWTISSLKVVPYNKSLTIDGPEIWSCISSSNGINNWDGLGVWELTPIKTGEDY
jgi:hypothetical protein